MVPGLDTQVSMADRPGAGSGNLAGRLLPIAALVFGLLMTLMAWWQLRERELQLAEQDFEAEVQDSIQQIREQLMSWEVLLRSGAAMMGTVASPNPQLWLRYVNGLNLGSRFPALTGVGFAPLVEPKGLELLQREQHVLGRNRFSIRPPGRRDLYAPIIVLEPATPENRAVIGFDMLSEPVRRKAMLDSRDSGLTRLSGTVLLQQDADNPGVAGMLMYAPVYAAQVAPRDPTERRRAMRGWVYAPFRVRALFDMVLGSRVRGHLLRIADVTDAARPVLLLEEDGFREQADAERMRFSQLLDVQGRHWQLDAVPRIGAPLIGGNSGSTIALMAGVITSVLLYLIAWLLARMRERAHALAARMSESWRRSEERFRSAIRHSPIGMALLDHGGVILEANPTLGRILAQPAGRLVGSLLDSHFLGRADGDAADSQVEGMHRIVRRLRRADGGVRHARLVFATIPGDDHQGLARLAQVEDITEQVQAEARIRTLNRTLESRVAARTQELSLANEEMEAFAYSVSHDLRGPLRAIRGFSQLLLERHTHELVADARSYLERVASAALRMDELIEALLCLARIGRGDLVLEPLDLGEMAEQVVADLRVAEPHRQVEVDIEPGLRTHGDRSLVANVLENLIGNAWKFSGGREVAHIRVGRDADGAFFVHDDGAGFDPAFADKLFKPFQRLHSQREFSGHGIGLSTVRRIIERHGGVIRATSQPGQGATFTFTLPQDKPGA